METSFDFEPVGAVASEATNTSSIEKKLDAIIAELTAIKENTAANKQEVVAQPIVEAIPEADEILKAVNTEPVEEETVEAPEEKVEDAQEVQAEEVMKEEPTFEEIEKVEETEIPTNEASTEELGEEPFTPVNVANIDMDSVPSETNITSIEDLLASVPQTEGTVKAEQEVLDEIKDIEVAPVAEEPEKVEQPIVQPVPAPVQADPVIVPAPVPAPAMEPTPVPQPIVEPVPVTPVAPVEPVTNVVEQVEEPTMEFKPDVLVGENNAPVQAVETPVVDNAKKFTVVTPLYAGMANVKTGDQPHRVMPMPSNEALLSKKDAKTLINKAA